MYLLYQFSENKSMDRIQKRLQNSLAFYAPVIQNSPTPEQFRDRIIPRKLQTITPQEKMYAKGETRK